jgi:hypothetical protein
MRKWCVIIGLACVAVAIGVIVSVIQEQESWDEYGDPSSFGMA